jgi:hypothetical protein
MSPLATGLLVMSVWAVSALPAAATAQTVESRHYCSNTAANIVLYLDVTTPYDETDQSMLASGIGHIFDNLGDGDRISIRTIGDSFTASARLLDLCKPYCKDQGFFGDLFSDCTAGVIINDRKKLRASLRNTLAEHLRGASELPFSEIIRTISMSGPEEYRQGQDNRFYIFSDMIENSTYLSGKQFFATAAPALMARVKKDQLIPHLDGAEVHVFGFGRNGITGERKALPQEQLARLKAFWTSYFSAAGATFSLEQNLTSAD